MENEQGPAASMTSNAGSANPSTSTATSSSATNGRPAVPQISVYSGIPDRQTVQVIQQALHRQPSTAAQYLQQMYAAQQQHLMLQTAALQQQHLSSAQLHSLAAVQQASIVAGRQSLTQNGTTAQQTASSQATINLATSPAAAQLMSRAQGVSASPTGISQQAVLLGNASSPALTASQAQMYLRAQMLIFTPTATVTAVHPEPSSLPAGQQSSSTQVQNLAIRSQQGVSSASPSQAQLQALGLKQAPGANQSSLSVQLKNPSLGTQGHGGKGTTQETFTEGGKKEEGAGEPAPRGVAVSRSVTTVSSRALLTPAFAQIQPHQLLQQHKQAQFVIQPQQPQAPQRSPAQAHLQAHALQTLALQPAAAAPPQGPVPVLPKPGPQTTVFHSTVSPQALTQNGQLSTVKPVSQPAAQPMQLTAVNLQIQPVLAPAVQQKQDDSSKEQSAALVLGEPGLENCVQQSGSPPQPLATTTEQNKEDCEGPAGQAEGTGVPDGVNVKPGAGSALAMTSGNGSNAPSVTGSTPQNAENKPPQAIVKPQILTHLIEGFVIQEGAEPFPVERPSLLIENLKKQKLQPDSEKQQPSQGKPADSQDCEMEDLPQQELKEQEDEPTLKCELCGLVDFAYKFKRSKRFCSTLCAKRYNVGCTKRLGLFHPDKRKPEKHKKRRSRSGNAQSISSDAKKQAPAKPPPVDTVTSPGPPQPTQGESSQYSDMSSYEEPPSPLSAASSGAPRPPGDRAQDQGANCGRELPLLMQHFLPSDPTKWNVEEVYTFIQSLPGCEEIAEEFRSQEIDGQALLLLKEDHLMSTMNIKLGPALKIYARISMLKDS